MTNEVRASKIEESRERERDASPRPAALLRPSHRFSIEGCLDFLARLQVRFAPRVRRADWSVVRGGALVLTLSFVSASIVSTSSASMMVSAADRMSRDSEPQNASRTTGNVQRTSSVPVDLTERIALRNLFHPNDQLTPEDNAAPPKAGFPTYPGWHDAKATAFMVGNEVRGFLLTKVRTEGIFAKLGFQDGDVIERINGIKLTGITQAINTIHALRNETKFKVQVRRNGKVENVHVDLETLR